MANLEPRDELELGPTYRALTLAAGALIVAAVVTVLVMAAMTAGL